MSVVLFAFGGGLLMLSLYGWFFFVTAGPAHGPGAEVGVVALLGAFACFWGAYRSARRD